MHLKPVVVALCVAASSLAAQAITVYDTASFVPTPDGAYKLDGFGRGTSNLRAEAFGADAALPFFDTWNINVAAVAPGTYNFGPLLVDAVGGLVFSSVTFNSYDEAGVRHSVLFTLNGFGSQASGFGTFTVRSSCPVASCVWIDVAGLQPAGGPGIGYGGTTFASAVPEPAGAALLALGLALVGGLARRRRLHAA